MTHRATHSKPPSWAALAVVCLWLGFPATTTLRAAETVTTAPVHEGETASAPIPPELHVRNEGGSDRSGLCVFASALINGQWQKVPGTEGGKDSVWWRTAKGRPGGGWPEKLSRFAEEVCPGEKYAHFENATADDLDRLSRMGYPMGAVMGYGDRYPGKISHMISLVHFRKGGRACVVDNNYPGEYSWMPAREYFDRFTSNGAWAFVWTRLPPRVGGVGLAVIVWVAAALLALATMMVAAAAVVLAVPRRPAF